MQWYNMMVLQKIKAWQNKNNGTSFSLLECERKWNWDTDNRDFTEC